MATITALEEQKKNRQRVNVYLDGKYAFGLQAFVAATLRPGQTLSPEQATELQERDSAEVAYERALGYLSYRPRSRAEIEAYLVRKKVPRATVQAVIGRLTEAGLLDDQAFARYWVENREAFRPRGVRSLHFELQRKGITHADVDAATEEVDETASAYRAAREHARRLRDLDYVVFRRRLGGFLQRRGFGYDVVKEVVERIWKERQVPTPEDQD
jgi:regulatory protein